MKKWFGFGALASAFLLGGCGNEGNDLQQLVVGATPNPHAIILEWAQPILADQGIDLEVIVFTDWTLPNWGVLEGELDANFYQHIPGLNNWNENNGTDLVPVGAVHVGPIGIYSPHHASLDELPEGASVILSSNVPDHGRLLLLLQDEGLIQLDPQVDPMEARVYHIIDNPKNLDFQPYVEPGMLMQAYRHGEGDIILINTNFALDGGLNPKQDALALEGAHSPFANEVVVQAGNEDNPLILALVEVLQSPEAVQFIWDYFDGAIIPVN